MRWVSVLGLAGAMLAACSDERPRVAEPVRPAATPLPPVGPALVRNALIISIDTLRADRLQAYGASRDTSPNLAALGQRGVVFTRAQAQSAQTAPSHASLLTSTYGETHGIINVHGDTSVMRGLPPGLITLADVASRDGIQTAAFVSNGNLTRAMGMNRGFALWDEKNEDVTGRIDACRSWMSEPDRGRFLALVHTYQVHAPYVPPREIAERFIDKSYSGPLLSRLQRYWPMSWQEQWAGGVGEDYWAGMLEFSKDDVRFLSDLYDGEIAYTDSVLRKLLQELATGPRAADTAVIVLSDHGEEFMDHGKYQHDQLFQELIHVPLMMSVPAVSTQMRWTGNVDAPVELVDVAPTVAELLGVDARGAGWEGRSLVPLLDPLRRASAVDADRAQFSELTLDPAPKIGRKQYRTVTWHGWKYIHGYQPDIDHTFEYLFDLNQDPGERVNRLADTSAEAAEMLAKLKQLLEEHRVHCLAQAAKAGEAAGVSVDEEMRRNLEQLGYTGGDR